MWPFVEGEDESFCLPVTTFPIIPGLQSMFFLNSLFTVETGKSTGRNSRHDDILTSSPHLPHAIRSITEILCGLNL